MRKVVVPFTQLLFFKKAIEEFNALAQQEGLKINGRVSYLLHKNAQEIYKEFWKFMQIRNEAIKKYAEKDEKGEVKFEMADPEKGEVPENMEVVWADKDAYEKEVDGYMSQGVELNFFFDNQIHRKLGDINGPQQLLNSLWELLEIFETYGKK